MPLHLLLPGLPTTTPPLKSDTNPASSRHFAHIVRSDQQSSRAPSRQDGRRAPPAMAPEAPDQGGEPGSDKAAAERLMLSPRSEINMFRRVSNRAGLSSGDGCGMPGPRPAQPCLPSRVMPGDISQRHQHWPCERLTTRLGCVGVKIRCPQVMSSSRRGRWAIPAGTCMQGISSPRRPGLACHP